MLVIVGPIRIDHRALERRRRFAKEQFEPGRIRRRCPKIEPLVARVPEAVRGTHQHEQISGRQRRADQVIDEVMLVRRYAPSELHRESASKQTWVPPSGALTRNSTSAVRRADAPTGISNDF